MKKIEFINEEQTKEKVLKYSKEDKEILVIFNGIKPYPLLSSYLINLFRISKTEKFRLAFIIPKDKIELEYFRELKKFIEIYSSVEEYENLKIYTSFEIKIYENNIYVRKLMKSILIDNNFNIKERSLNNFFDKEHDCQYNSLYIVDFTMQKFKSLDEIKKIKNKNKDSIVILLTKEEEVDIALSHMSIGIDQVIVKPFDSDEFIKTIKRLTLEAYFKRENRMLLDKITKREAELRYIYNQINDELKLASDIQKSLLPNPKEEIDNYEITHIFKPSLKIGGDFYENIKLNSNEIFIAFADISGHGIPSALLSAMLKMSIHNRIYILKNNSPNRLSEFLSELNEDLIKVFPKGKFVSMFSAILNTKTNELTYSKTSQEPAFLLKSNIDNILELTTKGILLGIFSKKMFPQIVEFEVKKLKLEMGDKILFFTDGITEAENKDGKYYGEVQFKEDLLNNKDKSNDELLECILNSVYKFTNNNQNTIDDISLLIVNNKGR